MALRKTAFLALVSLVSLVLLAPGEAAAQSAEAKATAEALFEEGRRLVTEGKFKEACPKFAESNQLDTGVGTLLHLGACYEQMGLSASAWATFREAAALAARSGDKREALARQRAARLEGTLVRVIVAPEAPDTPGLEVRRDNERVAAAAFGVPTPLDAGDHVFRAQAPGYVPWESHVNVPAGAPAPVRVVIPRLDPAPVVADAPAPAPVPFWSTPRVLGVVAAGVGVASFGATAALAVASKSQYNASNVSNCQGDACNAEGITQRNQAGTLADAATATFIAGGALVVVGAILFFTAPAATPKAAVLTPVIGPRTAGLFLSTRF